MRRSLFRALLLIAAAPMSISAVAAAGAGAPSRANPPIIFAQTQSDLQADPAARFGRLPNGMTYVIYKNKTPPGAAAVWMRVGAGSAMEQENQRGLAHFIEHMAFNGSKNVPNGEMIKLLERDGLQFGADTNAQTSFFDTTYMLNLPNASDSVVGHALFLMRETAGNLLFQPDAIDHERGVILGEERTRDSTGMQAMIAEMKRLFPGTIYPDRLPIGLVDVIKTAKRPEFLRFYNDFYRPEYTTLVVVGDIDPDKVEADVKRRFADWRPGPQSPAALSAFGKLKPRVAPEAKLFIAEGLPDSMSVSWVVPPVDMVETKAKDLDDGLFAIANSALNERFSRAAKSSGSAFLAAELQRQDIKHTGRVYSLSIRAKDGQDRAAFDQAMAMLREYLANGPTQSEIDRTIATNERFYTERLVAARTSDSQEIMSRIMETLGSNTVFQSAAQALEEFKELKPQFTLDAVRAAVRQLNPDNPPLLWRQGSRETAFDEAAMIAAYRAAIVAPLNNFAAPANVSWPYTHFGTPSAIVERKLLPETGATRVTFANGAMLTVKKTDLEDNAIYVAVRLGNGERGFRADQLASAFVAKQVGLGPGGLGKLSADDLRETLAGHIFGLGFGIGNNASELTGKTTKADLALQLQVLAAFATDPGFRPEIVDQFKAAVPSIYADARTSPDGVYATEARSALYGDDPRFVTPSQTDVLAVTNDAVKALFKDQLSHGPLDITIVGDITPDDAIRLVGATFGALPPLPAAVDAAKADSVRFPTHNLHRIYMHDGRADQNISVIAWPTIDYYSNPRSIAGLEILAAIMTMRELEEVREKQGATYSASVRSMPSRDYPGFGYLISRATVRPEVDDSYYRTVSAIAADLKSRPVTPDELARARQPLIEHLRNERSANGYWLSRLSSGRRDPRPLTAKSMDEQDLQSITAKDVQALARTYLDMTKALRIQVKPKDAGKK